MYTIRKRERTRTHTNNNICKYVTDINTDKILLVPAVSVDGRLH